MQILRAPQRLPTMVGRNHKTDFPTDLPTMVGRQPQSPHITSETPSEVVAGIVDRIASRVRNGLTTEDAGLATLERSIAPTCDEKRKRWATERFHFMIERPDMERLLCDAERIARKHTEEDSTLVWASCEFQMILAVFCAIRGKEGGCFPLSGRAVAKHFRQDLRCDPRNWDDEQRRVCANFRDRTREFVRKASANGFLDRVSPVRARGDRSAVLYRLTADGQQTAVLLLGSTSLTWGDEN